MTVALVPLAVGVSIDCYVAATRMVSHEVARAMGVAIFILLMALWYALPLALRWR